MHHQMIQILIDRALASGDYALAARIIAVSPTLKESNLPMRTIRAMKGA